MIDWLNGNGYKIPEEAKPILDKYVAKKDYYFIANKVNLKNKFAEDIEKVENFYEGMDEEYKKFCDEKTQAFYDLSIDNSIYHFDYRDDPNWSSKSNYCFMSEDADEEQKSVEILNSYIKDKINQQFNNEDFKIELGNGLEIVHDYFYVSYGPYYDYNFDCYKTPYSFRDHFIIQKNKERIASLKMYSICSYDKTIKIRRPYLNNIESGCKYKEEDCMAIRNLNEKDKDIIMEFLSFEGDAYNEFFVKVKERNKLLENKIEPMIYDIYEVLDYSLEDFRKYSPLRSMKWKIFNLCYGNEGDFDQTEREKFKELYSVFGKLESGVGTPLKFKFQPHQPYYPLEISSLNIGETVIEIYVLTNSEVTDQNNILKVDESKKINSELREKLEPYINLAQAKYVTRLSYKGDLKDLYDDAEFKTEKPITYEEDYNFLQKIFNWVSNLFS